MSISGGEAKRLGVKSLRQCPFIVNYNFFSLYTYAEIKHSDCMLQVTWIFQSECSYYLLMKSSLGFCFVI